MDVAFFTETYFPQINGVTYTISEWKQELERRGHDVHVVYPETEHSPGPGDVPVPSIDFRFVDEYKVGVSFPGDLSDRIPSVDVVHTHGPFIMGLLASRMAARDDVPLVASHHTPAEHYYDYVTDRGVVQWFMDATYNAWIRRFYRRCDHVLSPSRFAARRLGERIGAPVTPLSNGIDTEFFSPGADGFRDEHGIEDERVIGFCGRLGYEKRLEDLVQLRDHFDGAIVVAGDGFAKDHYLEQFEEADITYVGRLPREQMPAFYAALDIFVMPSTAETQGISVLEANACGTPVVGADAMALTDTIREGTNGYRYPPGDIEALHDRIEAVYEGYDRLAAGARRVGVEHSIEKSIDDLLALYTSQ